MRSACGWLGSCLLPFASTCYPGNVTCCLRSFVFCLRFALFCCFEIDGGGLSSNVCVFCHMACSIYVAGGKAALIEAFFYVFVSVIFFVYVL